MRSLQFTQICIKIHKQNIRIGISPLMQHHSQTKLVGQQYDDLFSAATLVSLGPNAEQSDPWQLCPKDRVHPMCSLVLLGK